MQDSDSAVPEIAMSVEASMPTESPAPPEIGTAMEGVESAVPEKEEPDLTDLEISDDESKAKAKAKPRVVALNVEPPPNPIPLPKLQRNLFPSPAVDVGISPALPVSLVNSTQSAPQSPPAVDV